MKIEIKHIIFGALIIVAALLISMPLSVGDFCQSDMVKEGSDKIFSDSKIKVKAVNTNLPSQIYISPFFEGYQTFNVKKGDTFTFVKGNRQLTIQILEIYPSVSRINIRQCIATIDLCDGVDTPNICDGFTLYSQKCDSTTGLLSKHEVIESNSINCGCIIQDAPNTCDGYDLWSQKQTVQCVEGLIRDQLLEEKSTQCGYMCETGEEKIVYCTDETPIITETCYNNEWTKLEPEACPLNWTNLEMILTSYLNQITTIVKGLLS